MRVQPPDAIFGVLALALGAAFVLPLAGCERQSAERAYGEAVDVARARPLAEVLEGYLPRSEGVPVVVRGEVGEVCGTAGCWFALRDGKDGKVHELLIDLAGSATFTVPVSLRGRTVVVDGRIVGEPPDLKLAAVGLVVEAR